MGYGAVADWGRESWELTRFCFFFFKKKSQKFSLSRFSLRYVLNVKQSDLYVEEIYNAIKYKCKEIIASSWIFLVIPDPLGYAGRWMEGTKVSPVCFSASKGRI